MKNLCSGTQCGGFQVLLILDLWGIRFHAVIVLALGKNLLFKSVPGHCAIVTIIRGTSAWHGSSECIASTYLGQLGLEFMRGWNFNAQILEVSSKIGGKIYFFFYFFSLASNWACDWNGTECGNPFWWLQDIHAYKIQWGSNIFWSRI